MKQHPIHISDFPKEQVGVPFFNPSLFEALPSLDIGNTPSFKSMFPAIERQTVAGTVPPVDAFVYPLPIPVPSIEVIEPPANRLIEILKHHYPTYKQNHKLPKHVRHAMQMIQYCHTSALGGHVERCPDGHIARVFYNNCGHRFCIRCAARQRRAWLDRRLAKLIPVRHYHGVFTIPHAFNDLWQLNPKTLGDLLFQTATGALRDLLRDSRWLGAEVGITVTLETWDERLNRHPHLHCLVTGGGLTPEGVWMDAPNPRCLVAVKPLMWEFRKRFCLELKRLLNEGKLTLPTGTTTRQWLNRLKKINRRKWEVFIAKPPEDGGPTTDDILRYLSKDVAGGPMSSIRLDPPSDLSTTQLNYLKSVAMSDNRIGDVVDDQITFQWGAYNPDTGKRERNQIETMPVDEFLRRYLQHVSPSRYQTVRHYGLYTGAKRDDHKLCLELLADRLPPSPVNDVAPVENEVFIQQHTCPVCNKPLIVTGYIPSSTTGFIIPRVPLGHAYIRPPTDNGGGHDP